MNQAAKARMKLRLIRALRLLALVKTDDWRYYRTTDVKRTWARNIALPK